MKKASKSILIFGIILVVALSFAILNACDKTDKVDSSSDEHNHTYGEWSVITAATCTTDGSKKRACTICQKEETETILAPGHSYGNWTTVTEATCTTGGQKKRTCSVCEYEETKNISALGHDEIRHEAKAATCTEIGWEAYVTCSRCDYTTFDEIPALGHNFVDDVCVRCQDVLPTTEGLSYSLSADETSYTVVGIGTATDTEIVIPSRYNGLPVTSIGDGAFENCSNITSITIGNGVTNIGEAAFSDCSGLKSITIPASVTNIRYGAFAVCTNLTSITVNAGNSVYHSAGNCLIEAETKTLILGCNTSVIPDDDSVTSIGDIAFFYCDGLTSITIPDGVTSIGEGAFYYCSKLTSITITASVTSIGSDAFSGTAWYNNQPDGVVYAGKVLYEYKGTMPDNTQIEIIDGTKSIADYAFSGCSGLTSITIPDSVTNIGRGAFSGTAWYNNQPDGVVYAGKVLYEYKGTLPDNTQIEIIDGTKSIADNAFSGCSGLTSVTIPDSVTSIGRYAFYNCSGLTSITIGNGVTSIRGYAFYNCNGLTSVTYNGTVSEWNNIDIGSSNDALINATKHFLPDGSSEDPSEEFTEGLSYSLSADETSYTVVGIGTATDTEIVIPSRYNGLPVTNIGGGAFLSCNSMTSITIPAGVTSIEMGAFDDCSGLTTIYYRGNIASWCGIRGLDNIMSSTRSLYIDGIKVEGALVIPDGASKIEEFAFVGCCGITSVTVGNGVASIGRGAFMSCEDITQITIDNAAISIDAFAFAYCNKLTSITYNGTTAQWENVTKGENWVYGTNITVHCTDGDVTVA